MYCWILLALVAGVTVAVFLILFCVILSFSTKSWINNSHPKEESAKEEKPSQNVVITDPYSGKLMNLERVSNASSLRSTQSIGFIAYDKSNASHSRGRATPIFHTGSIKSTRSNKSVSSSVGSINHELKPMNVNPLFKDESSSREPWLSNSTQMRARGLIFE